MVNVVLNVIFIPFFGLWAVVGATVISFALTAFVAQHLSNKYYFSIKYDLRFIVVVGCYALAILFIGLSMDFGNIALNVISKIFLVIVFFVTLYSSNFHNVREHLGIIVEPILSRFTR